MAKNEITIQKMRKLYDNDTCFRTYVDRVCKAYGYTKEFAFQDCIVQSYAEYVLKDQDELSRKECVREYKQSCGC